MGKSRPGYPRGRIGRGLLLSLFLHGQILVPLLAWLFWWGNFDEGEVGVTFESVKDDELPPDLPPVEKPPQPKRVIAAKSLPPAPARVLPPEQRNRQKEPERLAEREPPRPTPAEQKPEPPKPDNRTDKPKVEAVDLLHQKIVDLDMGKEVEAPADAKYSCATE